MKDLLRMGANFWDDSHGPGAAAFPEGRETVRWKRRAVSLGEDGFIPLPEASSFLLDCVSDLPDSFSPTCVQKKCSGKGEVACCKCRGLQTLRQSPSNSSFPLFLPPSWDTFIFSPGFFHLLFFIYTFTFYLFLHFKEIFFQLLLLLHSINYIFQIRGGEVGNSNVLQHQKGEIRGSKAGFLEQNTSLGQIL